MYLLIIAIAFHIINNANIYRAIQKIIKIDINLHFLVKLS